MLFSFQTQKGSEMDKLNHDQEVKFMKYVTGKHFFILCLCSSLYISKCSFVPENLRMLFLHSLRTILFVLYGKFNFLGRHAINACVLRKFNQIHKIVNDSLLLKLLFKEKKSQKKEEVVSSQGKRSRSINQPLHRICIYITVPRSKNMIITRPGLTLEKK